MIFPQIERLSSASPISYLEQLVAIEAVSFPNPLGWNSLQEDLKNPDVFVDGALVPNNYSTELELVAYSILRKFYDEMHIMQLATHPQFRHQGYGKFLVQQMLKRTQEEHCLACLLEVRPSNLAAIALYQQFGFRLIGKRTAYYQDNGEDALVMRYP